MRKKVRWHLSNREYVDVYNDSIRFMPDMFWEATNVSGNRVEVSDDNIVYWEFLSKR